MKNSERARALLAILAFFVLGVMAILDAMNSKLERDEVEIHVTGFPR